MAAYCAIGIPLALFGSRGRARAPLSPA
jgi:hypothetical protein